MAAPGRPEEDRAIDAMRKPVEVLTFMGIDEGMTVLEVVAGEGYYAELLAAAVGPDGAVYAQNNPRALTEVRGGVLGRAMDSRFANDRIPNVTRADRPLEDLDMDGQFDAAMTFLTLHDQLGFRGEEAALAYLSSVSTALRPGGLLGFIDHVGIAGQDNAELHRIEIEDVERLLAAAGFEIEARSNLLANAADDHTLNVFDPSIRRMTDRVVIRARKR